MGGGTGGRERDEGGGGEKEKEGKEGKEKHLSESQKQFSPGLRPHTL